MQLDLVRSSGFMEMRRDNVLTGAKVLSISAPTHPQLLRHNLKQLLGVQVEKFQNVILVYSSLLEGSIVALLTTSGIRLEARCKDGQRLFACVR